MMLVLHMCWLKVIERSSVNITSEYVDVRFTVGLPARGRSVLGQWAYSMLVENLPNYIHEGMLYSQQVRILCGIWAAFPHDESTRAYEDVCMNLGIHLSLIACCWVYSLLVLFCRTRML